MAVAKLSEKSHDSLHSTCRHWSHPVSHQLTPVPILLTLAALASIHNKVKVKNRRPLFRLQSLVFFEHLNSFVSNRLMLHEANRFCPAPPLHCIVGQRHTFFRSIGCPDSPCQQSTDANILPPVCFVEHSLSHPEKCRGKLSCSCGVTVRVSILEGHLVDRSLYTFLNVASTPRADCVSICEAGSLLVLEHITFLRQLLKSNR